MNLIRTSAPSVLLTVVAALSAGGCGPSQEEAIIAKNRARPKPGWVRLVNFSSRPLELWMDNRPSSGSVAAGAASGYSGTSPKAHKFVLKSGDTEVLTGEVEAQSDLGTSVVVTDQGGKVAFKTAVGEPRIIPKGSNKLVVFDLTGKAAGFEVKDENGMTIGVVPGGLSQPGEPMTLEANFRLVSGGKTLATAQVFNPMEANTGFILPGSPTRFVIFGNSPKTEPLKTSDFN
ncbi:MAG: hypothetical protein JST30_11825 [Armatimonadetes bacterium]|nr:hypothetical protein [Armatimonadota bacterium]